jgi:hypothetical protein
MKLDDFVNLGKLFSVRLSQTFRKISGIMTVLFYSKMQRTKVFSSHWQAHTVHCRS